MRFTDFLSDLLDFAKRDDAGNIVLPGGVAESASNRLSVEELALFSVIDLIASAGSLCEWRTYQGGKRVQKNDWYAWNISPNPNQNATEFKRILIARLLRFNEALVFARNGNYYIADSFHQERYAFRPNRYTNITCCNLSLSYTMLEEDVFYFRLANQHAAALLGNLRGLYSKAMEEAWIKYQHSGGRSGIVQISAQARNRPTFEKDMETLMNERFRVFFEKKNAVLAYFSALPGRISEAIQGAITVVTNWGSNMLNQAVSYISNLVSSVHARISQIPGLIMSSLQSALSGLINWGSNMKAKATSAIDNVRSAISSGLERVKSLFNFSWSLPHIRLPHFNISGSFSLSPPSVPRISVAWYAKGGILNGAQIFGSLGNKLLGGGEAGPEAVLPLSGFYSELRSILASFIGSPAESIDMSALYSRLDGIYERLGRLQVVLDTGALVGETVDQYDAALAERQMLAARGV